MTRRILAALFFCLFFAVSGAFAQADLAVSVGGAFTPDSSATSKIPFPCILTLPNCNQTTVKTHSRTAYEATLGLHLIGIKAASLSLEFPVMGIPARTVQSTGIISVPRSFSSVFVTPSVRLRLLSGAAISPFVSGGAGFVHFRESKTLTSLLPNPFSTGTNASAFQVGGGVDIKTPVPHLGLRGEVRDYITGRPNFNVNFASGRQQNLFVGGGIVLHF